MGDVRDDAVIWFMALKPAFEETVFEQYIDLAIISIQGKLPIPDFDPKLDVYITDFVETHSVCISTRALNRFSRARIHTLRDLTYVSRHNIGSMRNCGEKTELEIIDVARNDFGITLDNSTTNPLSFMTDYNEGNVVLLRLDIRNCRGHYKRGDAVTIKDIDNHRYSSGFTLPLYTCVTNDGRELYLSPGEIMKPAGVTSKV